MKDLSQIDLLYRDGFRHLSEEVFIRPPGKFLVPQEEKGDTMETVYQDPYTIPWNFVPIEKDLLKHVLADETLDHQKSRILEIGCGFGKNSLFLKQFGFKITGVDISYSAIERSREFMEQDMEFIHASATDLPFDADAFDIVLDLGCLHCMPPKERKTGLNEIRRVLQPKGQLYSRMFKSMPQEWLLEQPFHTPKFGLSRNEVLELFSSIFDIQIIEERPFAHYIKAWITK